MDKIKLAASLKEVINDWANTYSQEVGWIESILPPTGIDLMTNAAINVLDAIEQTGSYTEQEMGQ